MKARKGSGAERNEIPIGVNPDSKDTCEKTKEFEKRKREILEHPGAFLKDPLS